MPHNNKKCFYDGYSFDSYAERNDYIYNKSSKNVSKVVIKPKFILLPGFIDSDNKKIRPLTFTPDLLIIYTDEYFRNTGIRIAIRDTKPWNKKKRKFILESVFKIKWKLLKYIFMNNEKIYYTSPSGDGCLINIYMSGIFKLTA